MSLNARDEEQKNVARLYSLLDDARARAEGSRRSSAGGGSAFQQRVDREVATHERVRELARYAAAERGLCFGRIDRTDGDTLYIGRIGLRDEEGDPALIDWRAEAARPFYTATVSDPGPLARRRHLHTKDRTVVGLDDEVFDLEAMRPDDRTQLVGEAALLATLRAGRTGRMHDVVATIQAEQDEVVRAAFHGVLVVQGGPGTGKTVAALHRAAYLLYTHRETLSRRGVLIIGPNTTFLRYIERVLPGLGETDVALSTLGELYPGIHARETDLPQVAVVKGGTEMADRLAAALADRQRVPEDDVTVEADGLPATLTLEGARKARDHARSVRAPHNIQRRIFVHDVLAALAEDQLDRLERSTDEPLLQLIAEGQASKEILALLEEPSALRDDHDLALAKETLWADPKVRALIDSLWPELTPERFLTDLFADPQALERIGCPELHRPSGAPWTVEDVPLLDEAAELLGTDDTAERVAARRAERERQDEERYARGVLEIAGITEVDAESLAERQREERGPITATERLADREWTYGHVIVDEAQELSAMAWRAVMRRIPTRSLTVVGDLAQTGGPAGARSWADALAPHVQDRFRELRLLVNYRTPGAIMRMAEHVLATVDPEAVAPRSVREEGDPPDVVRMDALDDGSGGGLRALVDAELDRIGEGKLAVIVSGARHGDAVRALPEAPAAASPEALDEPAVILTVGQSKGLEFDAVVLVDPAGILAESPNGGNDLYVALTRATRRLTVVHSGDLPSHLGVRLD